ncbi:outer membrane lipoprotein LolB [Verticiella sediminum]|uniref:Outer-membrane lipoprotein LolB n=1 Tax=Verticiella sediminum TaxID=1247510 RepID=A0A556B1J5_9BURK|nr:outer membrane lipoprotein LolB [Verticiella sediminum]
MTAVARRRRAWAALLLAGAVLAGCAAPPAVAPVDEAAVSAGAIARSGRFALRSDEYSGKQHAVQGGFAWRDDGRALTLDLSSPMGAIIARVEVAPDGRAVLTEANGTVTEADTAEALVERVLGSPFPVQGLRYWLRGGLAPSPAAQVQERDAQGRPQAFAQAGWQVRVTDYDALGPVRMELQRDEPGRGRIQGRLVITPPAP